MKHPHYTPAENLTVARIRLAAARYELRLLRAAVKRGAIPTSETVYRRSLAATMDRAFH